MAEIYSSAHNVMAWIGEDSSIQDGHHIFELCQALVRGPEHPWDDTLTRDHAALWEVFASRRYFTRLWIVQELVHASNIKFICGSAEIKFATLIDGMHLALVQGTFWSRALQYTDRSSTALRYQNPSSVVLQALQLVRSIDNTRRDRTISALFSNLPRSSEPDQKEQLSISCTEFGEVLYELRHLSCSDERDRVYAMMSLCSETKTTVLVDYTIDCTQVYYNLAKIIYTDDMLLVAASQHAMGVARDPELPSWIPDWRVESRKPQPQAQLDLFRELPPHCISFFSLYAPTARRKN
ncbi:hypothetical protein CB0940_09984 [Cercospora beticola]|uniref:Heterokaryon incompatibility domain-containing protein n=1 Tax=Cercospora beticola TaxID=122368 RepID=A0A2G5HG52_CERBT|nr:hypothetical protein CB0940_09984 [Cercospora beticola]PIA91527.1 hypothetical protein CB0940_09984 [Cercospora beticola]